MDDKRFFKRVKFESTSQIEINNKSHAAELLDISLRGALLSADKELPMKEGEHGVLYIHLPQSDITMTFDAKLVHNNNAGNYGFKFLTEDIDTITHLRRLLELNMGEEGDIGVEISHWLKK